MRTYYLAYTAEIGSLPDIKNQQGADFFRLGVTEWNPDARDEALTLIKNSIKLEPNQRVLSLTITFVLPSP